MPCYDRKNTIIDLPIPGKHVTFQTKIDIVLMNTCIRHSCRSIMADKDSVMVLSIEQTVICIWPDDMHTDRLPSYN